jgi:hypothetical protein
MARFWTFSLPLCLFLAASCGLVGDDDDDDDTGSDKAVDFKACGGDPRGDWVADALHFTDASSLLDLTDAECKKALHGVSVSVAGRVNIGTATYNRDLTYTIDLDVLLTKECLRAFTGESAAVANDFVCNDVEDQFRARPAFASAACSVEKESCSCALATKERSSRQDGAYTVDGDDLVLGTERVAFCVKSNSRLEQAFEDTEDADLSGVLVLTH